MIALTQRVMKMQQSRNHQVQRQVMNMLRRAVMKQCKGPKTLRIIIIWIIKGVATTARIHLLVIAQETNLPKLQRISDWPRLLKFQKITII